MVSLTEVSAETTCSKWKDGAALRAVSQILTAWFFVDLLYPPGMQQPVHVGLEPA